MGKEENPAPPEVLEERDPECIYEITTFYANNAPCRKALAISLKYPDWCEFEKTQLYQELISYLEYLKIPE